DPLREELLAALDPVRPHRGSTPFFSTVTGSFEEGERLDASYWWRNLRNPVLFAPAVARLVDDGYNAFVEVDPHPLLVRAVEQTVAHVGRDAMVLSTLRRDEDERTGLLDAIGALYVRGAPIAWSRLRSIEAPPADTLTALGMSVPDA